METTNTNLNLLDEFITTNKNDVKTLKDTELKIEKDLVYFLKSYIGRLGIKAIKFHQNGIFEVRKDILILPFGEDSDINACYIDESKNNDYKEFEELLYLKYNDETDEILIASDKDNRYYKFRTKVKLGTKIEIINFVIDVIKYNSSSIENIPDNFYVVNKKKELSELEEKLFSGYVDFLKKYIKDNCTSNTLYFLDYNLPEKSTYLDAGEMILPYGDTFYMLKVEKGELYFQSIHLINQTESKLILVDSSIQGYLQNIINRINK